MSTDVQPYRIKVSPEEILPLGDRVLVRHLALEEKAGSLFIPPVAQEKAAYTQMQGYVFRGEVVAVGRGCNYIERLNSKATLWKRRYMPITPPFEVAVGDIVLFERRREAELLLDGVLYTLCHETQSILAIEGRAA